MALVAYRHLLRAARLAFEGDAPVLAAAQSQIRSEFINKSALDPSERPAAIQHAQDVARILRENVVQGRRETENDHNYKLRIHEFTEKGDNDSIKTAGAGVATGGGCCGGSGSK
ncbi:unnamed protein product [Clonostachys rhizophaga]|uniref:Mitochondrial zinc maintenance protein 1, mitochondrial n=2 Tax=Clonostachys TaxID=110564 RepID=A0A9N9YEL7_9HYPO|nr:unnamed protein product [Clonostachys byssicola]CAH0014843.1 unnamed protein product [Clonostachys rhizophaga]